MRKRIAKRAFVVGLGMALSALSACAHKDLMAPCTRDSFLWSFGRAYAAASDCGPLLPVNR
jgi:hypothetical protein